MNLLTDDVKSHHVRNLMVGFVHQSTRPTTSHSTSPCATGEGHVAILTLTTRKLSYWQCHSTIRDWRRLSLSCAFAYVRMVVVCLLVSQGIGTCFRAAGALLTLNPMFNYHRYSRAGAEVVVSSNHLSPSVKFWLLMSSYSCSHAHLLMSSKELLVGTL